MNMRITRLKVGEKKDICNNPNPHRERQSCWIQLHWHPCQQRCTHCFYLSASRVLPHFPYPEEEQPTKILFTNNSKKLKKEFKRNWWPEYLKLKIDQTVVFYYITQLLCKLSASISINSLYIKYIWTTDILCNISYEITINVMTEKDLFDTKAKSREAGRYILLQMRSNIYICHQPLVYNLALAVIHSSNTSSMS